MNASIVDLRYRMKDVLRAIDRGEPVTVLYRGTPKAKIVPIDADKPHVRAEDTPMFGMWKDREDMADPVAYIRKLREGRFTHLFDMPLAPVKPKGKPTQARTNRKAAKTK